MSNTLRRSQPKARRTGPNPGRLLAALGDVVGSRRFQGAARRDLQERLQRFLHVINKRYKPAILAQFIITEGDSFQGLLADSSVIPDIIWDLERQLARVDVRLGFGYGRVTTELKPVAVGMDGPAFHAAREAITAAREERLLGGVFRGFGPSGDVILTAIARLLWRDRAQMTVQQRRVAALLRENRDRTRVSIAKKLRMTKQGLSGHTKAIGWDDYLRGEAAWRVALRHFAVANRTGA